MPRGLQPRAGRSVARGQGAPGLLTGFEWHALRPKRTTKAGGQNYHYYLSMRYTDEGRGASGLPRLPAVELEAAVVGQLRHLLRASEMIESMVPQATALDPTWTRFR